MTQLVQESLEKDNKPATQQQINYQISNPYQFNPMPLRINADNSRPRDIICFWLIFSIVILLTILLAIFIAPKQTIIKTNQTQLKDTVDHRCMNPCGFQNNTLICNPFGLHNPYLGLLLRNINVMNQFALLYLDLDHQKQTNIHNISQKIQITLYSLQLIKQNGVGKFIKQQQIGSRIIDLTDQNEQNSFYFYGEYIQHFVGFYRKFSHQNYLLVIKFQDSSQIVKNQITPMLKAILLNTQFSLFIIIVRGIGFVVTLFSGLLYLRSYLKIDKTQRIIQQKLVLIMSVLILLFNDPFYWISILKPNVFMSIISVIFLTQFIIYLLFFWTFVALRIFKQQGQLKSQLLNWKTIILMVIYFGIYFCILVWYYTGIAIATYEGHFILKSTQISPNLSYAFQILFVLNVAVYIRFAIALCQQNKALMWRSRSWLYFNTYFAILLFVCIIIAGSFYQQNSKLILITYISFNLYCIYMQYMFTPNKINQQKNLIPVATQMGSYFQNNVDQVDVQMEQYQNIQGCYQAKKKQQEEQQRQ